MPRHGTTICIGTVTYTDFVAHYPVNGSKDLIVSSHALAVKHANGVNSSLLGNTCQAARDSESTDAKATASNINCNQSYGVRKLYFRGFAAS